ncbi:MAG: hypothetical protein CMJ87_09310 [Planctomycetes bacterium]|jgi:hypothetical protein|nr:hypothetical protein [Planctomycetota bacterium]
MGIVAFILGLGLGVFADLDPGARTAVGLVQNTLRAANNSAIARGAPARVRLDPKTGSLEAEGLQTIGTWHFEGLPLRGGLKLDGISHGGYLVDNGYQGQALSFEGEPRGARVEMDITTDAAWQFDRGFSVRLCLRREATGGGRVFDLGGALRLEVTSMGALRVFFVPEVATETGNVISGGRIFLESQPGALAVDTWVELDLNYDRRLFTMGLDGLELDRVEESAAVWHLDGPLVLGGGTQAFPGSIDNLRVAAVTASTQAQLPEGTRLVGDKPVEIVFAPGGGLDRTVHGRPLELEVEFFDGRRTPILVSLYGTVE